MSPFPGRLNAQCQHYFPCATKTLFVKNNKTIICAALDLAHWLSLFQHPEITVAQCSATLASVAATPPVARHLVRGGLSAAQIPLTVAKREVRQGPSGGGWVCSTIPLQYMKNPRKSGQGRACIQVPCIQKLTRIFLMWSWSCRHLLL